jgi:putative flippase GtrA
MTEHHTTAVILLRPDRGRDALVESLQRLGTEILPSLGDWDCRLLLLLPESSPEYASIAELMNPRADVHILHLPGYEGASPLPGLQEALSELRADVVVETGDVLSADIIVPLLQAVDEGADLVLGARALRGKGARKTRESAKRPPASTNRRRAGFTSLLCRIVLFFPTRAWFKITDPTTDVMAYRVSLLDEGDGTSRSGDNRKRLTTRGSSGASRRLVIVYRAKQQKKTITQVPSPDDGALGAAAVGPNERMGSLLRTAFTLRWQDLETKRFIRFGVVGFTGYIINASLLELFRHIPLSYHIAQFFAQFPNLSRFELLTSQSAWSASLAAEIAILNNYLLNNFWTFSSHRIKSPWKFFGKMFQFNLTSFGAVIIQFFVIGLATMVFGDTALVRGVALVFAIAFLIIPYNWTIYNRLIWRVKRRKASERVEEKEPSE